MSWQELRKSYGRELVNLRNEGRYYFLNTLFSVSEGVMYMQASFSTKFVATDFAFFQAGIIYCIMSSCLAILDALAYQ